AGERRLSRVRPHGLRARVEVQERTRAKDGPITELSGHPHALMRPVLGHDRRPEPDPRLPRKAGLIARGDAKAQDAREAHRVGVGIEKLDLAVDHDVPKALVRKAWRRSVGARVEKGAPVIEKPR